jgi:hypothetical protein
MRLRHLWCIFWHGRNCLTADVLSWAVVPVCRLCGYRYPPIWLRPEAP